ncbi:hypothetical protein GXP74_26920 [Streptacidiphilus sp. P02-A3a]|nr:hypothetical protein GXP74_26920 [Streptacidiphilus sp. P02-A3a]
MVTSLTPTAGSAARSLGSPSADPVSLLRENAVLAVFACLALGHLTGKLRGGPIQLGGICGTLIVFFANLNAKGLRFALLSLMEAVVVILMAIAIGKGAGLDTGTASGILAGAATESAVVGTAQEAIGKLPGITSAQATGLQAHVATAYSVCYLFGLITIVLLNSQFFPMLRRINLADACCELWENCGRGCAAAAAGGQRHEDLRRPGQGRPPHRARPAQRRRLRRTAVVGPGLPGQPRRPGPPADRPPPQGDHGRVPPRVAAVPGLNPGPRSRLSTGSSRSGCRRRTPRWSGRPCRCRRS